LINSATGRWKLKAITTRLPLHNSLRPSLQPQPQGPLQPPELLGAYDCPGSASPSCKLQASPRLVAAYAPVRLDSGTEYQCDSYKRTKRR
jgi:hypothetical protein